MRLRKRVDQALIPISTIQKFPALTPIAEVSDRNKKKLYFNYGQTYSIYHHWLLSVESGTFGFFISFVIDLFRSEFFFQTFKKLSLSISELSFIFYQFRPLFNWTIVCFSSRKMNHSFFQFVRKNHSFSKKKQSFFAKVHSKKHSFGNSKFFWTYDLEIVHERSDWSIKSEMYSTTHRASWCICHLHYHIQLC